VYKLIHYIPLKLEFFNYFGGILSDRSITSKHMILFNIRVYNMKSGLFVIQGHTLYFVCVGSIEAVTKGKIDDWCTN